MTKKTARNSDSSVSKPSLDELQQRYQKMRSSLRKQNKEIAEWLDSNFSSQNQVAEFAKQFLIMVAISGQLLISQPVEAQVSQNIAAIEKGKNKNDLANVTHEELEEIMEKMVGFVNREVGHLSKEEELYLEQQLTDLLGFEVLAEMETNRLNHSIGIMGGEQHLMRFPGDTLDKHESFQEAGMAPNRGAYGWFTEDGELTERSILREKYYFAVQTLYLPEWNTQYPTLKKWYKFRKMIVINPAERLAVVGVIGDAGPAMWVKKQFGGSPEVIREAKIWSPKSRGRVILLFIKDPGDQVPLGVIDLDSLVKSMGMDDVG